MTKIILSLFLLFNCFVLINTINAVDIGTCQGAIDPSTDPVFDLNQNLSISSSSCFSLSGSGIGHSVTINCNGYSITSGATQRAFFDTSASYSLDNLNLNDCNIYNSNGYYLIKLSNAINNINLLDSNYLAVTYSSSYPSMLINATNVSYSGLITDINFIGSTITISDTYGYLFYGNNADINSITFRNIMNPTFNSTSSQFYITSGSDLNYLSILDSNFYLTKGLFKANSNGNDSFLSLNFDDTNLAINSTGTIFYFDDCNYTILELNGFRLNSFSGTGAFIGRDLTPGVYFDYINLFDVNIISFSGGNGFFGFYNYVDSYLDFNFYGSNVINDGAYLFGFSGTTNITNLEISDLNYSGSAELINLGDGTANLNYVNIFDVNYLLNGNTLLDTYSSGSDNFIDFNFFGSRFNNNTSSNGLLYFKGEDFNTINIHNLIVESANPGATTGVFNFNANSGSPPSDVNYFNLHDSNIVTSGGYVFNYYINYDPNFIYFDFSNTYITATNSFMRFYGFSSYNKFPTLSISNLNLTMNSSDNTKPAFLIDGSSNYMDLNYISILDSNIYLQSSPLFYFYRNADPNIFELDLNGTRITSPSIYNFFYMVGNNTTFTGPLNIKNLTVSDYDYNLFFVDYYTINTMNIYDSNINTTSLAYVDTDANIKSGSVYNNVFRNFSSDINFVNATTGRFNLDFNTSLNTDNNTKRLMWLNDNSDATGGNLWLNSEGNNLCTLDNNSPEGICDNNISIKGTTSTYYDKLSLILFDDILDLSALSLSTSPEDLIYGSSVDLIFDINNSGDSNILGADYNIIFYYNNGSEIDLNLQPGVDILVNTTNNITYSWMPNIVGDINLCAKIVYNEDMNNDNDFVCVDKNIGTIDLSQSSLTFLPNIPVYGDDTNVRIKLDYNNIGTADTNADYNIVFYVDNIEYENYLITDILAADTNTSQDYNWVYDLNVGSFDINVCAIYSATDYNNENNCIQDTLTIYHRDVLSGIVDLNTYNPEYGSPLNINIDLNNIGDYDSNNLDVYLYIIDTNNVDENVVFVWENENILADSNLFLTTTWDVNLTGTFDVNLVIIPSESDYNNENDYNFFDDLFVVDPVVDLSAISVSVSPDEIIFGRTDNVTITLDYNNIGLADAIDDYNVVYYIDDIEYANYLISTDLNQGLSDTNSYIGSYGSNIGTLDLNVCVLYNSPDNNSLNNCFDTNMFVYHSDLNIVSIITNDYIPVYGEDTIDLNIVIGNRGDYNSDFNVILYLVSDLNSDIYETLNWTLQNIDANTTLQLDTQTWIPNIDGNIDLNIVIIPNVADYNNDNHFVLYDKNIYVKYVDLNVSTIVSDVNAGHVGDINCVVYNIGDGNATLDYNVFLYIDGVLTDYNTETDTLDSDNNLTFEYSWNPHAKINDRNIFCVVDYFGTDYNSSNDFHYIDKNVGADSEVNLSVTDISLSSTVAGAITITCDINNIGDENTASDYNVKMYVDDVLLSSSDLNTQINVNAKTSATFSWTSTAGTHTLECVADYNVNNYEGYDQNIDNNSYSESFTITNPVVNNPSETTSYNSVISGILQNTSLDSKLIVFNTSNNYNPVYINNVNLKFKFESTESPILRLDYSPYIDDKIKIIDSEINAIKYLKLDYVGDQTKLKNAEINFNLRKIDVKDKSKIKLARYSDNEWEYYTPNNIEDKGAYYLFTVDVSGFSYFSIVEYNKIDPVIDNQIITKINDVGDINVDKNKSTIQIDNNKSDVIITRTSFNYWLWVSVISILIVIVSVGLFVYPRRKSNAKVRYKSHHK